MRILFFSFLLLSSSLVTAQKEYSSVTYSSSTIDIGLVVSDLEKAIDFYKNIIGMTEVTGFEIDASFGQSSGLTDNLPFSVRILVCREGDTSTKLKIMSFNKEASHPGQDFIHDDTGVQYLTFFVDDLVPAMDNMKKVGIPFLGDSPVSIGNDRYLLLVKDPDGNFVELIGPK